MSSLDDVAEFSNKSIESTYIVFCSLDFSKHFLHLSSFVQTKWIDLINIWHNVMSNNKYDVGLTTKQYKICLNNHDSVKSYVPCHTLQWLRLLTINWKKC